MEDAGQSIPNVGSGPLIAPAAPGTAGRGSSAGAELREADCGETAKHFSAWMAAELQIVPSRPKLMEGQFGGSKGPSSRGPGVTIILWV